MTNPPETAKANRLRFRAWHPATEETEACMDYNPKIAQKVAITKEYQDQMTGDTVFSTTIRLNDALNADDGVILMQATGLFDKNGLEIFESDLLSIDGSKKIWIVKWIDVSFYISAYDKRVCKGSMGPYMTREDFFRFRPVDERYEIIGNVYQNPELLPPTQ